MSTNKICPLMSGNPVFNEAGEEVFDGIFHCQESKCQFWIEVFTTELIRTCGCANELHPQMVDGQLRV